MNVFERKDGLPSRAILPENYDPEGDRELSRSVGTHSDKPGKQMQLMVHALGDPLVVIAADMEASLLWLERRQPDVKEVRALLRHAIEAANQAIDIVKRVSSTASDERRVD
jgi:hypothetical protein